MTNRWSKGKMGVRSSFRRTGQSSLQMSLLVLVKTAPTRRLSPKETCCFLSINLKYKQ